MLIWYYSFMWGVVIVFSNCMVLVNLRLHSWLPIFWRQFPPVSKVSFMRTSSKAVSITFKIEDANGATVVPWQTWIWKIPLDLLHLPCFKMWTMFEVEFLQNLGSRLMPTFLSFEGFVCKCNFISNSCIASNEKSSSFCVHAACGQSRQGVGNHRESCSSEHHHSYQLQVSLAAVKYLF